MTTRRNRVLMAILISGFVAFAPAGAQKAQPDPGTRRAMLEQRLRERTGEIVKKRLGLTDDQMQKLQASNRQFEQQRTVLFMQERELRRELRQQIMSGDAANQNRVAQLLDQVMQAERQRLDLLQSEQREVAKFLTPVQRAKLLTVQSELRRRAQEMSAGGLQRQRGRRVGPPGGFQP